MLFFCRHKFLSYLVVAMFRYRVTKLLLLLCYYCCCCCCVLAASRRRWTLQKGVNGGYTTSRLHRDGQCAKKFHHFKVLALNSLSLSLLSPVLLDQLRTFLRERRLLQIRENQLKYIDVS